MVSETIPGRYSGRAGFGRGSKSRQAVSPQCDRSDNHRIPQIVPDTLLLSGQTPGTAPHSAIGSMIPATPRGQGTAP